MFPKALGPERVTIYNGFLCVSSVKWHKYVVILISSQTGKHARRVYNISDLSI
jgi:hypothetical protein